MKNVILIGDSIRLGYQGYVRHELEGYAGVWAPDENGRTSQNVLDHLDEWVLSRNPDVVHVNAGLHDVLRPEGETANRINLWQYYGNVREIVRLIRERTSARLICATTTPVGDVRQGGTRAAGALRFDADIRVYNKGILDLAKTLGFEINDLYQVVMDVGTHEVLTADGVHFTDEGYTLLGKAVADFIRG